MYETNIDYSKPLSRGSTVESTTHGPSLTNVEFVADLNDTSALRGVSEATADLAECTCPGTCERDHANE